MVTRSVICLIFLSFYVIVSTVILGLPTVLGLSCPPDPSYWVPEDQHALQESGLLTEGNVTWAAQPVNVFKAEPGANASIVISYRRLIADSSLLNLTVNPIFRADNQIGGGLQQSIPAPSWLRTSSNSIVFLRSGAEHVNATVNFEIRKDAPLGQYLLYLAVEKADADSLQDASCFSGYSTFFLRVAMDRKAAVTTTTETTTTVTTLTTTFTTVFSTTLTSITSVTLTERVTEPFYLAWALSATALVIITSLFVVLRRNESGDSQRRVE